MRTFSVPTTLILIGCCSALGWQSASVFADEACQPSQQIGFMRLYNGRDLSGWEVKHGNIESWQADGELLSCVQEGGEWLRTKKNYSDFVLLSNAIPGWQQGISGMKVGGRRKLIVPPELAYGKEGHQDIVPPNATLV